VHPPQPPPTPPTPKRRSTRFVPARERTVVPGGESTKKNSPVLHFRKSLSPRMTINRFKGKISKTGPERRKGKEKGGHLEGGEGTLSSEKKGRWIPGLFSRRSENPGTTAEEGGKKKEVCSERRKGGRQFSLHRQFRLFFTFKHEKARKNIYSTTSKRRRKKIYAKKRKEQASFVQTKRLWQYPWISRRKTH